jgi:SNF2 family DNA or RNA helicase
LDPTLLELQGKSPKTEWILQYLSDYPDKPVIIFSKFTSYLNKLSITLGSKSIKHGMIIGATDVKWRKKEVDWFQQGVINILLINIDAGKEGLTLDKAETTIFTDKYPPVGDIEQAEDRFVATSEDKKDKPHTIIELCIKNTYDEQLYSLLEKRKSETDVINDFKKYIGGKHDKSNL